MKLDAKLIMYAGIGFLTPLLPSLESLTPEKMASMRWPQWLVVALSPILSVLVTLKALASVPEKATESAQDEQTTPNATKD